MNNADRQYLEGKFWEVNEKLDNHSERLARMEERWKMVGKFAGLVGGTIALITTVVVKIIWR